jgi:hypothetical protein
MGAGFFTTKTTKRAKGLSTFSAQVERLRRASGSQRLATARLLFHLRDLRALRGKTSRD